ncbi:MAG: hypothetical protein ABI679_07450, partial [Gemmatimonadota bacterium]
MGTDPTTGASWADGFIGFMNAALGTRLVFLAAFFAGLFAAFLADFFAVFFAAFFFAAIVFLPW